MGLLRRREPLWLTRRLLCYDDPRDDVVRREPCGPREEQEHEVVVVFANGDIRGGVAGAREAGVDGEGEGGEEEDKVDGAEERTQRTGGEEEEGGVVEEGGGVG